MRRRRAEVGLGVVVLAATSFLASAAPALATSSSTSHQPGSHHQPSKRASIPHDVVCNDMKAQEASQSHLGLALATSLQSGHVDRAKHDMLGALDADLRQEARASSVLKGATRTVQNAEKRLIGDVERVKTAVIRSTSIEKLLSAFSSLGRSPHLASDGVTVANWYDAHCGQHRVSPAVTPTTASSPGAQGGSNGSGGTNTSGGSQ